VTTLYRRIPQLLMFALLALAVWPAARAVADAGGWSAIGPAATVLTVATNPANELQMFAAGPDGLWQSPDGGGTWQQVSATALGHFLAVDPFAPAVLYASAISSHPNPNGSGTYTREDHLLKSTDGGVTWSTTYQVAGLPSAYQSAIQDLLVDPNRQGALFVALSGADPCCAQVARSLDGGQTWALILPPNIGFGGLNNAEASSLATLSGVPGLLYVGTITYHGGEDRRWSVLRSPGGRPERDLGPRHRGHAAHQTGAVGDARLRVISRRHGAHRCNPSLRRQSPAETMAGPGPSSCATRLARREK